jgi:hypothetical protein
MTREELRAGEALAERLKMPGKFLQALDEYLAAR